MAVAQVTSLILLSIIGVQSWPNTALCCCNNGLNYNCGWKEDFDYSDNGSGSQYNPSWKEDDVFTPKSFDYSESGSGSQYNSRWKEGGVTNPKNLHYNENKRGYHQNNVKSIHKKQNDAHLKESILDLLKGIVSILKEMYPEYISKQQQQPNMRNNLQERKVDQPFL